MKKQTHSESKLHCQETRTDGSRIAASESAAARESSKSPSAPIMTLTPQDIARFHAKYICNLHTGCWEWLAAKHKDGYGQLGIGPTIMLAHRLSYLLHQGILPPQYLRHTCDNPGCVNPAHLIPGTQKENMKDRQLRHRDRSFRIGAIDRRSRLDRPTLVDRFHTKYVIDADGCWVWTAAQTSRGYGLIIDGRRRLQAHRLSYELHKGGIPKKLVVRHKCDKPLCVNPAHLELGTRGDNVRDRDGRNRTAKGSRSGMAVLNEPQARLIKQFLLRQPPRVGHKEGPYRFLARWFGVSTSVLWSLYADITWKHVVVEGWELRPRDDGRVITAETAILIKHFLARHPPGRGPKSGQCKFLEEWLGVPRYIVTNISRGRSWRSLTA
jgi:hypothetical protein